MSYSLGASTIDIYRTRTVGPEPEARPWTPGNVLGAAVVLGGVGWLVFKSSDWKRETRQTLGIGKWRIRRTTRR